MTVTHTENDPETARQGLITGGSEIAAPKGTQVKLKALVRVLERMSAKDMRIAAEFLAGSDDPTMKLFRDHVRAN